MQLTISSLIAGSFTSLYSSQYPAECFHPLSYGAVLFLSPFLELGKLRPKRLSHSSWSHSRDVMQTVQLQKPRGSPLVLSTFSVLTKNVLRFLDRGMINVQQGGLSKTAKIKSRSMSHTVEVEFLGQGRKVIQRKRNIGKAE